MVQFLGTVRFDSNSLGIVARDGLTTRLLVIDYLGQGVIEQVMAVFSISIGFHP